MKEFKTVNEAAKMMNLSTGHIRQLCIDKKLEGAQKMGNIWIIPEKSILEYKPGNKGFSVVWERRRKTDDAELRRKALAENAATRPDDNVGDNTNG